MRTRRVAQAGKDEQLKSPNAQKPETAGSRYRTRSQKSAANRNSIRSADDDFEKRNMGKTKNARKAVKNQDKAHVVVLAPKSILKSPSVAVKQELDEDKEGVSHRDSRESASRRKSVRFEGLPGPSILKTRHVAVKQELDEDGGEVTGFQKRVRFEDDELDGQNVGKKKMRRETGEKRPISSNVQGLLDVGGPKMMKREVPDRSNDSSDKFLVADKTGSGSVSSRTRSRYRVQAVKVEPRDDLETSKSCTCRRNCEKKKPLISTRASNPRKSEDSKMDIRREHGRVVAKSSHSSAAIDNEPEVKPFVTKRILRSNSKGSIEAKSDPHNAGTNSVNKPM